MDSGIDLNEMIIEAYDLGDRHRRKSLIEMECRGLAEESPHEHSEGRGQREQSPAANRVGGDVRTEYGTEYQVDPGSSVCSRGATASAGRENSCHGAEEAPESANADAADAISHDSSYQGQEIPYAHRNPDIDFQPATEGESSDSSQSDIEDLQWGDCEDEFDEAIASLEEAAATPLFEGADVSSMAATYIMLNSAKLHGCTDVYIDEMFRNFSQSLLPKPNSLPTSYREAADYVKKLGHFYKSFDVCVNNCRMFRQELKDATGMNVAEVTFSPRPGGVEGRGQEDPTSSRGSSHRAALTFIFCYMCPDIDNVA